MPRRFRIPMWLATASLPLSIACSPAAAAAPPGADQRPLPEIIAQLDDESWARRNAASNALAAGGWTERDLAEALRGDLTPEQASRIRRAMFEVFTTAKRGAIGISFRPGLSPLRVDTVHDRLNEHGERVFPASTTLRSGDILLEIDGISTRDPDPMSATIAMRSAVVARQPGDTVRFVLLRPLKEIDQIIPGATLLDPQDPEDPLMRAISLQNAELRLDDPARFARLELEVTLGSWSDLGRLQPNGVTDDLTPFELQRAWERRLDLLGIDDPGARRIDGITGAQWWSLARKRTIPPHIYGPLHEDRFEEAIYVAGRAIHLAGLGRNQFNGIAMSGANRYTRRLERSRGIFGTTLTHRCGAGVQVQSRAACESSLLALELADLEARLAAASVAAADSDADPIVGRAMDAEVDALRIRIAEVRSCLEELAPSGG